MDENIAGTVATDIAIDSITETNNLTGLGTGSEPSVKTQKRGRGRAPKSAEVDLRIVEINGVNVITRPSQIKERLLDFMSMQSVSVKEMADKMGLSYQSLNKKLNNHVSFTLDEIQMIKFILNLGAEDVAWVFCLGDR